MYMSTHGTKSLRNMSHFACILVVLVVVGCTGQNSGERSLEGKPGGGIDVSRETSVPTTQKVAVGSLEAFDTVLEIHEEHPEILLPFSGWERPGETDELLTKSLEGEHPTSAVGVVLSSWLRDRDVAATEARVGRIVSHWNLDSPGNRLVYGFEWDIFGTILEPGWYSGMSDWSFLMLLVSLWQETDNEYYKDLADRLLEMATAPVPEGGTVWSSERGCWLSEYAWTGMREDQETAVLNGHQYALVALGVIASTTADASLERLFNHCVQGMLTRSAEFRSLTVWPYYMLNPRSVDTPDYAFYEASLFDSLASLTSYPEMIEEAEWRRSLLRRHFPVFGVAGSDGSRIMFTQIGPPHPYNLDWGVVTLECSDGRLTERFVMDRQRDKSLPIAERGFIDMPTGMNLDSARCTVSSTLFGPDFRIFDTEVEVLDPVSLESSEVAYSVGSTLNMASWSTETVFGVPLAKRSDGGADNPLAYLDAESRITIEFNEPLGVTADDLFVVEVTSSATVPIYVTLHGASVDCGRYYPPLERSDVNAVLLSTLGFKDCPSSLDLTGLTLTFYRSSLEQPVRVGVGRVIKFSDRLQMRQWFSEVQPYLPDDGG